jgi:nucleoside-diphosphate-sugar epimerase
MKTIVVLGGTGFVGQQIVRALSEQMVEIIPIVRLGKERNLPLEVIYKKIIVTKDINQEDINWWAENLRGVDCVINAAWITEPGKYLQSEINIDFMISSIVLAKGMASAGVNRYVGLGTCAEYDQSYRILSIDVPLKPTNLYAASKVATFQILSQLFKTQNISFVWCRIFYLYGQMEDERRLVPYIRNKIKKGEVVNLTNGTQIRDFMDVSDAGKIIAKIAISDKEGPFNICSGLPITVRQMAEKIADEYGRRDLLSFGSRSENEYDPQIILGIPNI